MGMNFETVVIGFLFGIGFHVAGWLVGLVGSLIRKAP